MLCIQIHLLDSSLYAYYNKQSKNSNYFLHKAWKLNALVRLRLFDITAIATKSSAKCLNVNIFDCSASRALGCFVHFALNCNIVLLW